jgi:hypothetical protein
MTRSAAVTNIVHHVITCTLRRQTCVRERKEKKKKILGDDLEQ